jgi:hypothetical protein
MHTHTRQTRDKSKVMHNMVTAALILFTFSLSPTQPRVHSLDRVSFFLFLRLFFMQKVFLAMQK